MLSADHIQRVTQRRALEGRPASQRFVKQDSEAIDVRGWTYILASALGLFGRHVDWGTDDQPCTRQFVDIVEMQSKIGRDPTERPAREPREPREGREPRHTPQFLQRSTSPQRVGGGDDDDEFDD